MAFLNKHIIKVLIAFFIVLFFIFVSPNDSQAVMIANTRLTDDIWSSCRDQMDDNLLGVYSAIRYYYVNSTISNADKNRCLTLVDHMQKYNFFIDTFIESRDNKNYISYKIYFYTGVYNSFTYSDDVLYIYYDDNSLDNIDRYGVGKYYLTPIEVINIRSYQFSKDYPSVSRIYYGSIPNNFDIWSPFYCYKGNSVYLNALINGVTNDFQVDPTNDFALLSEIAKNTKDSADSTKELTDFVKNDSVDSSSSDFNTSSGIGDNTLDFGVNNIFTQLYNTINNWEETTLRLPFPNTNQYIEINSATLRGDLAGAGGSVLVLIIQSFWLFIVGRFILKDVLKYYEQLKSGDIVKSSETNIKADML